MRAPRNEQRYQFIKLVKSGRTLAEVKALMKATSAGLHTEYTSAKDLKELAALENINHLFLTRSQAIKLMELKLAPKRSRAYPSTRQEAIAKFATGYRGALPLDWKRDGNLIRRGKPNRPRPGSSKGKVSKTIVSGATNVLKDFGSLVDALLKLQERHGKQNHEAIRRAFRSVRISVAAGKSPKES